MSMSNRPSGGSETPPQPAAPANEVFSLVDRHTSIEGDLSTNRDIRIEGTLRGTIQCQGLLYVAEGADIDATVEAASITVAGKLSGTITCRGKLQIMPEGRVTATVNTETLVIDEGAFYEGELNMGNVRGSAASPPTPSTSPATEETEDEDSPTVLRRFSTDAEGGSEGGNSGGSRSQRRSGGE